MSWEVCKPHYGYLLSAYSRLQLPAAKVTGEMILQTIPRLSRTCPGFPPKVGIPMSFGNHQLVDVTRSAYCLVGMGGISLGSKTLKIVGQWDALTKSEPRTVLSCPLVYLSRDCMA